MAQPSWASLTDELSNTSSPVSQFLKHRYPNVKDVQRRYRAGAGTLVVAGGLANPGTVGGAFDWAVRFMLNSQPSLTLAFSRFLPDGLVRSLIELARILGVMPESQRSRGRFEGPVDGSAVDEDTLLRGCWALALFTELRRRGRLPGSPLLTLDHDNVRAADLLDLPTSETIDELRRLCGLARTALLPPLSGRRGLWALGPTFEGSTLMNADADLIAGGMLVELKSALGDKRADGSRRLSLDGPTLHQMLGYVLLDFPDDFAIRDIGLYAARYGYLATWRLPEFLNELAGRSVDLASERTAFHAVLRGQ
jgi:hypothetical protein